ncbi:MAG TPA: 50S ribosomal protein L5 [Candidatus Dojkabacteria bacterium]|nr:50S ribosomal protein L5 [Candidatus Dojkabacteria bacterium]HPR91681.1 50S ribosomal protein L5 [Candidatus Dojkabacteria bacterium]HRY74393.1 50S ribosomal protein L5 [Candidatus Dojkabacteria bacterium]HRZ84659.1 50S ribosomal protein L5 [Candidatus Dojkabacteria bacterium]
MNRLQEEYNKTVSKELMKEQSYSNVMQVPTLKKIVVNVGAGEAVDNKAALDEIVEILTRITGQKPVVNKAKKAVSAFKIRQGMEIGVSVTLRGERMWQFFDKLVNIVLPRTKDFRGLSPRSFDGAGNYSLGIEDHTVFIEIDPNNVSKIRSLEVTIVTSAMNDKDGKALLDKFGFPFTKNVNSR